MSICWATCSDPGRRAHRVAGTTRRPGLSRPGHSPHPLTGYERLSQSRRPDLRASDASGRKERSSTIRSSLPNMSARARPASANRITVCRVAGDQAGRVDSWIWSVRLARTRSARPLPAGLGTSGSTGSGSSPRMPYGPVTRCGCGARNVTASLSSSRSSPSESAHRLPPRATSITALPLRPARRLSRWLPGPAVRAVRPSANAAVSTSCSGGQPA
jgi:hypothetical protein